MADTEPAAQYDEVARIFRTASAAPGGDFDRIEEEFGQYLDESLAPRGPGSLLDLVATVEPPAGGVAVDVGCGSGRDTVRLAQRFGLQVHGVDPRSGSIQKAAERVAAEGLQDAVRLYVGRAEEIPLPDGSVDLLWCKEALTFTELDVAMGEFRRVMRPGAVGVVYQVLTGPAMSDAEAEWFASQDMGFGTARSMRPADVESAAAGAGLEVRRRVDYAGEWGEAGEEHGGAAGRRLLHASRLLRRPQRYIDRYGEENYRIMLLDCLWHVNRMVGKLWGVAFVVARPL
ncbi:methyltransferase domain-containing protein [Kribbella sp. GL6]|uniref:methyltransferase domain-containing protein n=1 Tax=Kribbella sp. GL6 TaxID=3419765 RepID=UPI003CFD5029